MVLESQYGDFVVPEASFTEALFPQLAKYGQETAIIDTGSGMNYSFDDVITISENVAKSLHHEGMRKGDVLVYCCTNNAESIFAALGSVLLGGVASGVNCVYTADELLYHFQDSTAQYVVTMPQVLETVLNAVNRLPKNQIKKVYVVGQMPISVENHLVESYDKLLSPPPGAKLPHVRIEPRLDPAFMPYSSGTTGIPKGVVVTHYNIVHTLGSAMNPAYFIGPTRKSAVIGMLPFFHIYGLGLTMVALRDGAKLVLMPQYDSATFLELMEKHKVTFLATVPPILVFLAKHPLVSKYDISSLHTVMVGAAPVGKELSLNLIQRFPHIKHLNQAYGMTEITGASHLSPSISLDEQKFGSCGMVVPNVECKVINIETGEEIGAMQDGEICVRSQSVMVGYLNKPEATAKTVDKEGWLHTGDIGHYDEDGFFYIVDRLKELIKVKGFQVAPAELEDLLLRHPSIADAAVIGIPDQYAGELPRAYIVKDIGNTSISEVDVHAFLKDKIATYKSLKGGVIFTDVIPKSASGKILRRLLRKQYDQANKSKM